MAISVPFHLKLVIGAPIVNDATVKLPWASQEKVTHGHRNHITFYGILIGTDLEGDFNCVLYLDSAGVTMPLDLVWLRMALVLEAQLGAKFFTCQAVVTTTINDHFD